MSDVVNTCKRAICLAGGGSNMIKLYQFISIFDQIWYILHLIRRPPLLPLPWKLHGLRAENRSSVLDPIVCGSCEVGHALLCIVLENLFGASQSLWPSGRNGDCGKCRQPEVVSLAFGSQIRSRGRWESHGISSQDSWSGLGLLFLGINRYPVPRHFYALLVKRVVEVVLLSSGFWLRLNINVPTFVCARDPRRAKQELGLRQTAVRGHRHVTGVNRTIWSNGYRSELLNPHNGWLDYQK